MLDFKGDINRDARTQNPTYSNHACAHLENELQGQTLQGGTFELLYNIMQKRKFHQICHLLPLVKIHHTNYLIITEFKVNYFNNGDIPMHTFRLYQQFC